MERSLQKIQSLFEAQKKNDNLEVMEPVKNTLKQSKKGIKKIKKSIQKSGEAIQKTQEEGLSLKAKFN